MIKFLFFILLLTNAALFSYKQGYLESLFPSGREPARMSNQLNPDKIRTLPRTNTKTSAADLASPAEISAPKVSAPAETNTPVAEARKPELSCIEIGNFAPERAKQFSARLAGLSLGAKWSQQPVREVSTHIVYIPSQGDKEGADKKTGELQRLGITDFYVIQDNSPMRWGISLGIFKTAEAARAHLANLNRRGVRSARIGERMTPTNMIMFQLHDLDAEMRTQIDKIRADFPRQEVRGCSDL